MFQSIIAWRKKISKLIIIFPQSEKTPSKGLTLYTETYKDTLECSLTYKPKIYFVLGQNTEGIWGDSQQAYSSVGCVWEGAKG